MQAIDSCRFQCQLMLSPWGLWMGIIGLEESRVQPLCTACSAAPVLQADGMGGYERGAKQEEGDLFT
jgi:hypothetical protein